MKHVVSTLIIAPDELSRAGLVGILAGARFKPIPAKLGWEKAITSGKPVPTLAIFILGGMARDPSVVTNQIGAVAEHARVVILADHCEPELVRAVLCAGASAYLSRSVSAERLIEALDLVLEGEIVFPAAIVRHVANCSQPRRETSHHHNEPGRTEATERLSRLSSREIQILNRLVHGDSNKLISRQLEISETTVKVHLKAILRKLGVRNRTQAAILALDHIMSLVGNSHLATDPIPTAPICPMSSRALCRVSEDSRPEQLGHEPIAHELLSH
jgi:two-component system nitrate/nitrite response regulator NarL